MTGPPWANDRDSARKVTTAKPFPPWQPGVVSLTEGGQETELMYKRPDTHLDHIAQQVLASRPDAD